MTRTNSRIYLSGRLSTHRLAPWPPISQKCISIGQRSACPAYHDKRFALLAALEHHETAIFVDADSRIVALPKFRRFPSGIAVLPVVRESIAEHLKSFGSWRLPVFQDLAKHLIGDTEILRTAKWCHEALLAITKDGRESRFFESWALGANFLEDRGVYSGEGGVIGVAAASTGWKVDFKSLRRLGSLILHEGGGSKLPEWI